jgi:Lipopolysaccharide-assembly
MQFLRCLITACAAVVTGGCAGYTLGPTNGQAAGAKAVQVIPFSNQTIEPRLGDAVTEALRKQLQRDGTFHLATHGPGDIVVNGVVTRYERREISLAPNDLATPQDYRISMTARVTARERSSDKVLFDGPVTGNTLVRVGPDLQSTERQALPLLATDLANNVTALLVDGSW